MNPQIFNQGELDDMGSYVRPLGQKVVSRRKDDSRYYDRAVLTVNAASKKRVRHIHQHPR